MTVYDFMGKEFESEIGKKKELLLKSLGSHWQLYLLVAGLSETPMRNYEMAANIVQFRKNYAPEEIQERIDKIREERRERWS